MQRKVFGNVGIRVYFILNNLYFPQFETNKLLDFCKHTIILFLSFINQ